MRGAAPLSLVLLLGAAAGCGEVAVGPQPTDAFREIANLANQDEWSAVWDLLAGELQGHFAKVLEEVREGARRAVRTGDRDLAEQFGAPPGEIAAMADADLFGRLMLLARRRPPTDPEAGSPLDIFSGAALDAVVTDDRARVRVRVGEREVRLPFVKRAGRWLLASLEPGD